MSKVESASVKLLIKILLLVAGYILLAAVSGSFYPLAVLALISVVSYLAVRLLGRAHPQPRAVFVKWTVPGAFLALIVLNLSGLIGTLTGVVDEDSRIESVFFIAFPFYLLSAAAVVADASRHRGLSLIDHCLFIALPFKLLAGPLERSEFVNAFDSLGGYVGGAKRAVAYSWLVLGLFMKFVVADRLNPSYMLEYTDPLTSFLCAFIFELKFYFDFAGYSFIAYGLALFFGIRLTLNFNHPFTARNVVLFWQQWHISLGAFLRRYIMTPHLGSFKGKTVRLVFVSSIFLVSAMWHGGTLNYLLWGLFHAVVYFLFSKWIRHADLPAWLGWFAMFLFFVFGRMLAIDSDADRLVVRLIGFLNPENYVHAAHLADFTRNLSLLNMKGLLVGLAFVAFEFVQVRKSGRVAYHGFRRPVPVTILGIGFVFFGTSVGDLLYARI
jgi:D-alanyl-lipoteichoic acid acyltransferase DltB (MBOAT superfamily)